MNKNSLTIAFYFIYANTNSVGKRKDFMILLTLLMVGELDGRTLDAHYGLKWTVVNITALWDKV